jgi:tetratricopeptide (TPR) repeat protein
VTGELEKSAQTFELWQQTYPRDDVPYLRLGVISQSLGNWEKALKERREALRLEPNNVYNYVALGRTYRSLDRLDEAQAVYKQADERKLESEPLLFERYQLAFLKGDAAQMANLVSAAMGKPGYEGLLLGAQADTESWYGKLRNAYKLTKRAMDSALHDDAKETAASFQVEVALTDVEAGYREQARAEANATLKLAANLFVQARAAIALARSGDMAGAEKLAAELDKTYPLSSYVQGYWLPSIRAAVALEHKDPNGAIEILKGAPTIEGGARPPYLRGEAYLMLHDGNAAAAQFQSFIDHPGVVYNTPWGALARLGLARAYALEAGVGPGLVPAQRRPQGAPLQPDALAKARAAYQNFLTLWKDADPDIPILKEAKAEYAKLQ